MDASETVQTTENDRTTTRPTVIGPPVVRAITPRDDLYPRIVKPVIDRTLALVLLVLLSPVLVVAAVAVAASLGRPIFYTQERVGLGGRRFRVIKFRTMHADRRGGFRRMVERRHAPRSDASDRRTGGDRRVNHKSPDDPRRHPVGEFLRKWSIDELPQLCNVLAGEMSLVGPRPELVDIVAREYDDETHLRHCVKPGITGLWQIGARGDGLMCEHPELDLHYARRQSFLLDCKILLRTPLAAVTGQKGY